MATAQKELHNQATNMGEHAKDMAAEAAAKAKDIGSNVAQKASDAASFIGKKADDATSAVGAGMKSVAGAIRDKTSDKGMIGATGSAVANTLEQGARYLEEQGLSGIGNDMTNLIRRNPIPALLVGIGLGFLVARAITPRS
jgi:hypothetical protein